MFRRLLSIGGLAGLFTVTVAATVVAGGGGFGAPGINSFTDTSAQASSSDSSGSFVGIFVDRGMQTFKLKQTAGPPLLQGPETVLSVVIESPTSFQQGCWIIPDSAFSVASNLSSASLTATPAIETPCPGMLVSAAKGGRPGLQAPVPNGGGGCGMDCGGPPPIPSVTVSLNWTSNGAVWNNRFTNNSRCDTFNSTAQGDNQSAFSTATGSVSLVSSPIFDPFANVSNFDVTQTVNGTLTPACGGF